ncbi:hypothetical protein F9K75_07730 [Brucella intermedia]|nr:hypothetical protein F9K77_18450 [Ochrobactrum sp. LMG 5442]KAB2718403.1 hypothetical protein F9K75_07730 [Brucella intermedia]
MSRVAPLLDSAAPRSSCPMEQSFIRNVEFSTGRRKQMFRAMILWLMGVPLILVLLIWYFFF